MKYIALVATLIFMAWTWSLAKSPSKFGLQEHQVLQEALEQMITEQIRQERPNAKNISFLQLYSETVVPGKELRIHVRVAIRDSLGPTAETTKQVTQEPTEKTATKTTEATAEATAEETTEETTDTLRRTFVLQSNDGATWAIVKRLPGAPEIEFKHGLRVTPRTDSSASPAAPEPVAPESPTPPAGEAKH